ncbi:uncharacterized protein LOC111244683 [Varroa destructor]|uniref:Uncharacterized protein n=1 Tax=Varroa destructor TaxID=109461 RepID=A0A7M7J724_VARDE|nr:uncharacterized protein LOC111244683 [Varroa destructor]
MEQYHLKGQWKTMWTPRDSTGALWIASCRLPGTRSRKTLPMQTRVHRANDINEDMKYIFDAKNDQGRPSDSLPEQLNSHGTGDCEPTSARACLAVELYNMSVG